MRKITHMRTNEAIQYVLGRDCDFMGITLGI
jgi:hypothetical protein